MVTEMSADSLISVKITTRELTFVLQVRLPNGNGIMSNRIKDSIPMDKKTGVVHQVNCSNCKASCVGETLCSVGTRLDDHAKHTRNH